MYFRLLPFGFRLLSPYFNLVVYIVVGMDGEMKGGRKKWVPNAPPPAVFAAA
jgi:hypothetical protein